MSEILPPSFERALVALLVGFLIGLDRERAEKRKKRRIFAGVRTFPLIGLTGAVSVLLTGETGPLLAVAAFLAVATVALISYLRHSQAGDAGATTEIAALATFLLGALAGSGQVLLSAALGIGVAVLLVAKFPLERFSRALTQEEMSATLELAVISGIVLPLLPNQGYGPWGVWNPFEIWLVVVLVSAVSFAGFIAVRTLGQGRGLALAGVAGGLVSSTAVTAAMASRAREDPDLAMPAAAGAILASVVMCGRVVVFAVAFGAGILPRLLPVTLAMAATGAAAAGWIARRRGRSASRSTSSLGNPSSLASAAVFALLYAFILLAVRAARELLGTAGLFAAASLSAVADVDAVTIAFVRDGAGSDAWRTAAAAVNLALVTNTVFKLALASVLGTGAFRTAVNASLAAMAIAGGLAAGAVYVYL